MARDLTGEHIILRKAKEKDSESMLKNVWSDEEVYKWMLYTPTTTLDEAIERNKRSMEYQKNHYAYYIALKETDEAIGLCAIKEYEPKRFKESGICIGTKYQGKGYGKEVLFLLLRLAFNKLKAIDFEYGYFHDNIKSKRLASHFGFKYTKSEIIVRPWDNEKKKIDYCLLSYKQFKRVEKRVNRDKLVTLDNEKYVMDYYRMVPFNKIKYFGRFLNCLRLERITKSFLLSFSWKNSSGKNELPPDFHNNLHHMMLDVMRIDDCVNEINGQEVSNSFKIESLEMKEKYGKNYKKKLNGVLCYIADTSDNNKFNYDGYYMNFKRVLNEHSSKIDSYHKNYPKCKTSVLMIFDQSNNYVQAENIIDAQKGNANNKHITRFIPHHWYADKKFIDCIKQCNSDYVIWFGWYKKLFVNKKEIKMPSVVIYDVKHIKQNGFNYDSKLMVKVVDEV